MASGLVLPQNDTGTLMCAGQTNTVIKLKNGANTYLLASKGYATGYTSVDLGPYIRDCTFDGNRTNQTASSSLIVMRTYRSHFFNVQVKNADGHGLLFTPLSATGTAITNGMAENRVEYSNIQSNSGSGIYAEDGGSNQMADMWINNNAIHANSNYNLYVERAAGFHVDNNQMYSSPTGNILMKSFARADLIGNNLDVTDSAGSNVELYIGAHGQAAISGNHFIDNSSSKAASTTQLVLYKNGASYLAVSIAGNDWGSGTVSQTAIQTTGFNATDLALYICGSGNAVSALVTMPYIGTCFTKFNYWTESGANIYNATGTNVGIGTSSPLGKLHIASSNSGVASVDTSSDDLVIENNGVAGLSIISANDNLGYISFGDPDDSLVGGITYSHISNALGFNANNGGITMTFDGNSLYNFNASDPEFRLSDNTINAKLKVLDSSGLAFTGNTSNHPFQLRTNNTARVHIDTSGLVGIGTTTPAWQLQVASSSQAGGFRPQLTISDSSVATNNHWSLANTGGTFYLSTSSPQTFATSSVPAFTIDKNGVATFGANLATCIALTGSADLCDGSDATGAGGGTFPFTPDSYGGVANNSTTTGIWAKPASGYGFIASSTFTTYASTTQITVADTIFGAGTLSLSNDGAYTAGVTLGPTYLQFYVPDANSYLFYNGAVYGALNFDTVTANRGYAFPNLSGTVVLGPTNVSTGFTSGSIPFGSSGLLATSSLVFDSGSNSLGVGTTSPLSELHVSGAGVSTARIDTTAAANTELSFAKQGIVKWTWFNDNTGTMGTDGLILADNAGNEKLGIEQSGDIYLNGNVGIGTTSPQSALHVYSGFSGKLPVSGTDLTVEDDAGAIINILSPSTFSGNIYFGDEVNAVVGRVIYDHTVDDLSLWTASVERLTIDSAGNVGIGTTTPAGILHVEGNSSTAYAANTLSSGIRSTVVNINTTDNSFTRLNFASNSTNGTLRYGGGISTIFTTHAASTVTADMAFQTVNAGTAAEVLRLTAAGNVGIGTTTPTWLLNPTSATAAQLALSAGAGIPQWTFRNAGGAFYIASTTLAGTATSTTPALTIASSGNVGIASSSPWRSFSVEGTVAMPDLTNSNTGDYVCFNTLTGEIEQNATACSLSSIRWKENVRPIDGGLAEILKLRPVLYDLKPEHGDVKNKPGFIAEEVESVLPNIVSYGDDGLPSGLDYPQYTAYLTKAIQELAARSGAVAVQAKRNVEESWQWGAIAVLIIWNIYLTIRRRP